MILVTRTTYHNLLIIFMLDQSQTFEEAVHRLARCLMELNKLSEASGRQVPTRQTTSSAPPSETSGAVLLDNYAESMHRAQQLLFEDAMGPTNDLLSNGHMSNLNIQSVDGINGAVHCRVGRYGEE